MKSFFIALRFLTRINIPYLKLSGDSFSLAKSAKYFTLVGILIGIVISAVYYASHLYFSRIITSLITVTVLIYICRALHLDGFADTIDGLYGGNTVEDKLEIMRDSRIGTMGVVGIVLLLLGKVLFIANISGKIIYPALMLMPAVGRGSIVFASCFSDYARDSFGIGKAFIECVELKELLIAQAILLAAMLCIFKYQGIVFFILVLVISFVYIKYINKEINGQTGDTLGALCEINEMLFLIGVYLMYR
ncbi:MAG: adenosylcobinamide-GDP ribazoletransferase [bacterium]|nr:adenosylcobinamide-GDP ribazoletransferase [bacterium]